MQVTGAGVSRKELALIRKTLKANPGCSLVVNRGPAGVLTRLPDRLVCEPANVEGW